MSWSYRGYPLGALFVIVTTCAVLVAAISPVVRATAEGDVEISVFFAALAVGGFVGLILGLAVGVLQFRAALGVILGAIAGIIIGVAAGGMALLSQSHVGAAAAAIAAGSILIVGVALVMRRNS
jgi:hypothetical protein